MTPNKPTTLREYDLHEVATTLYFTEWHSKEEVEDYLKSVFTSHNTELVSKIEEVLEESPTNLDPTSNYINKTISDVKRKIKSIINQYK